MRSDLLALSIDALITLANAGLVKRAQKELAEGQKPEISEDDAGLVTARFKDGATCNLKPSTPLREALCSCGAPGVCRHRVAAVLAYQNIHQASHSATPSPANQTTDTSWDPGDFSDEVLRDVCGPAAFARAESAILGPYSADLTCEPVPTAKLSTASVRFLVPHALPLATCDCVKVHRCEHVVLAVWAFRRARQQRSSDLASSLVTIALGQSLSLDQPLIADISRALGDILETGLTSGAHLTVLERLRARATSAGYVWIAELLEDLERQKNAYDSQSALFASSKILRIIAEVQIRLKTAVSYVAYEGTNEKMLPEASGQMLRRVSLRKVLGVGEGQTTELDQTRLFSLGARISADGLRRFAKVYFYDPDAGEVLVLMKSWVSDSTHLTGHMLRSHYASSKLTLEQLVMGEVLARGALRHANGGLEFSKARAMKTGTTLSSPLLNPTEHKAQLKPPVFVTDFSQLKSDLPLFGLIEPRSLGDHVKVLMPSQVHSLRYDAGEQILWATAVDTNDVPIDLMIEHRAVSPYAIESGWAALTEAVSCVAGELQKRDGRLVLDVLCIAGETLVVPDLAGEGPKAVTPSSSASSDEVRVDVNRSTPDVLIELHQALERVAMNGLRAIQANKQSLGEALLAAGYPMLSQKLSQLTSSAQVLELFVLVTLLNEAGAEPSQR